MEIPADIAGIVHSGRTNSAEEYALMDSLGISWTLLTFSWSRIEASENQRDFDFYDTFVDTARAAGIKIIGILAYDVPWIYEDGVTHRNITPDIVPYYVDYARHTAEHFRGRVDAWCIWNEPNTKHFWKGTREDFYVLTSQAANAVREADPDVTILGGAFNRNVFGLSEKFIRGLFESGAMRNADAVAFHPYELNPVRTLQLYYKCRKILSDYNFEDKIWITEVGYPTGGWYPTKVTEKKLPEYVVKTFVSLAAAGAPKILWYQLFDPVNRKNSNSEDFFGLVRSTQDYTSKGAHAFRLCTRYLAGSVYRSGLSLNDRPASVWAFCFLQPEANNGAIVIWKNGIPAHVKLEFPGINYTGNFTVHDPVTGTAVEAATGSVIKVGSMPVFVTW